MVRAEPARPITRPRRGAWLAETGILSWSPGAYIAIIADRIIQVWSQHRKRQLALI